MKESSESDSDEYKDTTDVKRKSQPIRRKRRKVSSGRPLYVDNTGPSEPNLLLSFKELEKGNPTVTSFEDIIDHVLPDYLNSRATLQEKMTEVDQHGQKIRPPTRSEVVSLINAMGTRDAPSVSAAITERRLKLSRERRQANLPQPKLQASSTVTPLPPHPSGPPPHSEVIDALYSIQTTPFETSFLSRLQGTRAAMSPATIAVDWETTTPWVNLMSDVRDHYVLFHPDRERPVETLAPITYTTLQRSHLEQVHDLLERVFWMGIDVSDSLDHSPERCTVVATYKRLVIGIAILSSPRETYITYLAVRAGWDNSRIARSMLYHLIMLNPNKDITLHVSVNNSAMLLYNRFGFKAEEFVAGFYEDYLDPQSRASKNAFRLRLRQQ